MAAPLRLSMQSMPCKNLLLEAVTPKAASRLGGVTPKNMTGGASPFHANSEVESARFFNAAGRSPTAAMTPSAAPRFFTAVEDVQSEVQAAPSALPRLLGRSSMGISMGRNEHGARDQLSERQLATSARDAFLARQGRISSRGQSAGEACE